METEHKFITGLNYWPINKAMYWWRNFDYKEIIADFSMIKSCNLEVLRIFLLWEDFQPERDLISPSVLSNLKTVADIAGENNLQILPTFFCGHMSGVNWMPYWMLGKPEYIQRFPVFSLGSIQPAALHNFYADARIIDAQVLQIREVCSALRGHEAIYAYDLGNESSNCVVPTHREEGLSWLQLMTSSIKHYSGNAMVTMGIHAEDLEENRHIWPQDVAQYCDFLTMHAYPFYLSWVDEDLDPYAVPFLGTVTAWLGGKPVLLSEFGVPSYPVIPPLPPQNYLDESKTPLYSEAEAASYYEKVLPLMLQANLMGGLAWCFGDYEPSLWKQAPLLQNPHERHFGLFRHDGMPKKIVEVLQNNITQSGSKKDGIYPPFFDEFDRNHYYEDPQETLKQMYKRYKQELQI